MSHAEPMKISNNQRKQTLSRCQWDGLKNSFICKSEWCLFSAHKGRVRARNFPLFFWQATNLLVRRRALASRRRVRCDSWLAGEMYMPRWKWGRKRVRIQFGNNCSCAAFWYPKCQRRRTRHRARNGRSRVCVHLTLCFWSGNRLRLFELGCGCGFIPET